ncbi:AAA family ATPase [Sphingobacterium multivorum]|uniref:AAA family ATPase n=1 Tax=Sphingobacterium multivorum TaxID=28454 RepID=UPI0028B1A46E|nr:AAA family ATPase [Sphingobacterium multivorum]
MFFFYFDHTNSSLHEAAKTDEDVSILIGENGSGKSMYLNELSKHHLGAGKKVIALANTVFDKFDKHGGKFRILRNSSGKKLPKMAIRSIIKVLFEGIEENMYAIRSTFEYIGFDFCFDIKLEGLVDKEEIEALARDIRAETGFYELPEILVNYKEKTRNTSDGYARITLDRKVYGTSFSKDLLRSLLYEQKLRKLGVISNIDICLVKNNERIPILGASSGELALLTSLIFVSAHIDKHSIILIDEPENSLHPKWQIEYIQKIVSLFYFYQPKIIIATHSPLIINGGKLHLKSLSIYKGNRNGFFLTANEGKNVEEIYEDYFDVTTPENRYLSEFVMDKFNLLAENKLRKSDFENLIHRLIDKSYDDKQQEALRGILELAKKID